MSADARDRLYELLPVVLRMRDADVGSPLRALLRVIDEQADVVQNDIARLYDNWFIETCDDWVVPYIAELIGYDPIATGDDDPTNTKRELVLFSRRDVARTIRARRRKGTLALLEDLARDAAGWPGHAVEGYRLLALDTSVKHVHLDRGKTADMRDVDALDRIRGPFDSVARSVDVRRPNSRYLRGQTNIPDVDLFVYRAHVHSITYAPAYCQESAGDHCFTFSVLGDDEPLFTHVESADEAAGPMTESTAPGPIRRRYLAAHLPVFYGRGKSFEIFELKGQTFQRVEPSRIVVTDLVDWTYRPKGDEVLVDPVLGRIAFNESRPPERVRVTYHRGFSWEIGGGEYDRPTPRYPDHAARITAGSAEATTVDVVDADLPDVAADFATLGDALRAAHDRATPYTLVELVGRNDVFTERLRIQLVENQTLHLRAADGTRPVLRLLDYEANATDALRIVGAKGAHLVLDGLLVAGRAIELQGPFASIEIRHCTIGPGWLSAPDASRERRVPPAIVLVDVDAPVCIEKSIVGGIEVHQDDARLDPVRICLRDSIVDVGVRPPPRNDRRAVNAIVGPERQIARATLHVERCTIFGRIRVHALELAENSLFIGEIEVARRQIGCMRFCYVPLLSRTPRRHHCQPDLARRVVLDDWKATHSPFNPSDPAFLAAQALATIRVRPTFNGFRYGGPWYAQLSAECASEILRGADDQSEMGVFHDLFDPQREDNLRRRLDESTPAGVDVGVFHAT